MNGKILRNRKGVSTVVETVILIALTLALVSAVWVITNNLINKNISSSNACFNVFDKVELDPTYTCYNNTASQDELWFSVSVGEIENIDDVFVGISGGGAGTSFKIIGDNPADLEYFDRTKPANMSVPGKNSGQAYIYTLPANFPVPEKIQIALIIDGQDCGVVSTITQFDDCSLLG